MTCSSSGIGTVTVSVCSVPGRGELFAVVPPITKRRQTLFSFGGFFAGNFCSISSLASQLDK